MGDTKLITAEQHNQTRREAKARQQRNRQAAARSGQRQETLAEGLFRDGLNERGVEMIDILTPRMTSMSPKAQLLLQKAAYAYVTEFTMNTERVSLYARHTKALSVALKEVEGRPSSLVNYAKRELISAFHRTK